MTVFEDVNDVVNLVNDFARNETTEVGVNVLAECHRKQVEPEKQFWSS